jgi:hypothetical protein
LTCHLFGECHLLLAVPAGKFSVHNSNQIEHQNSELQSHIRNRFE